MARKKISVKERLESARNLERKSDYTAAQKTYQSILRSDLLNIQAYNRLMIIHRKRRKYAAELDVIRQAIAAYRAAIVSDQQIVNDRDQISAAISRKLAQSLGLLDENGLPVFEDPQVLAWRQREAVVQKKLQKSTKI